MKLISRAFTILAVLGVVAAFSPTLPGSWNVGQAIAKDPATAADTALFATALPERRDFTLRVPWIGTVEPQTIIEVTALTAGRIESIEVADQTRVTAGQPLAKLGGIPIAEERTRLKDEIGALQQRGDLNRQKITRLQKSLQAQLATKDQLTTARDEQDQLDAQLRQAKLDLQTLEKQMTVTAPIDGTFTQRKVNTGQDVSAGQVIASIIDTDHLRITASLFPPPGATLQGKDVSVHMEGDQPLPGKISNVLPEANEIGATLVWIEGPEIDSRLRPGRTVSGQVIAEVRTGSLAVPQRAIVYDNTEHPYVFVQQAGNYTARPVKLGLIQDGWVEVVQGLEPDQPVVTRGAFELFHRQFNQQFTVPD